MRVVLLLVSLLAAGCGIELEEGGRLKPYESTTVTDDLRSARMLPAGAVPTTAELRDESLKTGFGRDGFFAEMPSPVSAELVERGKERFLIYCAPCHGADGEGKGTVVSRGFPEPESLKTARLGAMPPGYFVRVIDRGFGSMPSYDTIDGSDRWAIAAFILRLQDRHSNASGALTAGAADDSSAPSARFRAAEEE